MPVPAAHRGEDDVFDWISVGGTEVPLWMAPLAGLVLYVTVHVLVRLSTRPAPITPEPATLELGDEPPAVVNLLVNRWRATEDAAEATLLDLAARGLIELRQPGGDPAQTVIQVAGAVPADLQPFERQVLDRIRGLAEGGVVPVAALSFRDHREAGRFKHQLRRAAFAETRRRGLSRPRLGPVASTVLGVAALLASAGVFLGLYQLSRNLDMDRGDAVGMSAYFTVGCAILFATGQFGLDREVLSQTGRAVAAHWLGVREWLRGHDEFAALPPAAVAVWGQYLSYGAALGVTRTVSAVLDLGLGNRNRVWSSYGGRWRQVQIRYPRWWRRYGRTGPALVTRALLSIVAGLVLVRYHSVPADLDLAGRAGGLLALDQAGQDRVAGILATAGRLARPLGWLLLAAGGYRLVRAVIDIATARTITGQVLWMELWRSRKHRVLYYLAVDDGTRDRTTAWAVPARPACRPGDTVTVRVRPWSRRVLGLRIDAPGGEARLARAAEAFPPDPDERSSRRPRATGAGTGAAGEPRDPACSLLSVEEVGRALGFPVRPVRLRAYHARGVAVAPYEDEREHRTVLTISVQTGDDGPLTWALRRAQGRGTVLAGVGDQTYQVQDGVVARQGDTLVAISLLGRGAAGVAMLPELTRLALGRLPVSRGTVHSSG